MLWPVVGAVSNRDWELCNGNLTILPVFSITPARRSHHTAGINRKRKIFSQTPAMTYGISAGKFHLFKPAIYHKNAKK